LTNNVSTEIVFQEGNNVQSISVILKGLNEECVGITSRFSERFSHSLDFGESSLSPNLPGFDILNLSGNAIRVLLSHVKVALIDVGYDG
jgi:hypothetical protein